MAEEMGPGLSIIIITSSQSFAVFGQHDAEECVKIVTTYKLTCYCANQTLELLHSWQLADTGGLSWVR